jgi:hypothetical protein
MNERLFEDILQEGSLGDNARNQAMRLPSDSVLANCISGAEMFLKLAKAGRFDHDYFSGELAPLEEALYDFLDSLDN